MKKIILGLGTIGAIAAPVAAVVSCGTSTKKADPTPIAPVVVNLDTELAKTKNLMSSKDKTAFAAAIGTKAKGDVVTDPELGLVSAPDYATGVKVAYEIDTADNGGFSKIKVTLTAGEESKSKVIFVLASDAITHSPKAFKAAADGKIINVRAQVVKGISLPTHSYYVAPGTNQLQVQAPKTGGNQGDFVFTWTGDLPATGEVDLGYNDGASNVTVKADVTAITDTTYVFQDDSGPYAVDTTDKANHNLYLASFIKYNLFTPTFVPQNADDDQIARIALFREYLANGNADLTTALTPTA